MASSRDRESSKPLWLLLAPLVLWLFVAVAVAVVVIPVRGPHVQVQSVLVVVLAGLGVWAALLLLLSRYLHVRQWTIILVVAVLAVIVWIPALLGGGVSPDLAHWMPPALFDLAIWVEGAAGAYLAVLAYLMLRKEPAPLRETYTVRRGVDPWGVSFEDTSSLIRADGEPRGPDELAP